VLRVAGQIADVMRLNGPMFRISAGFALMRLPNMNLGQELLAELLLLLWAEGRPVRWSGMMYISLREVNML
jgi:hypothetical protein